jgi:hypothetical protein
MEASIEGFFIVVVAYFSLSSAAKRSWKFCLIVWRSRFHVLFQGA